MKKTGFIILINIILIAIWVAGKKTKSETKEYDINMTVASSVSSEMVEEVRKALEVFPDFVVQSFSENDWKIVLLDEIMDDKSNGCVGTESSVVGLIDYTTKTVTICGVSGYEAAARDITIHELCHYVDRLGGSIHSSGMISLYDKYKDGGYVTFSYAGIPLKEEYVPDITYAISTRQEFFAETMKDYLLHREYLQKNYSDIYEYYRLLFQKLESSM